MKSDDLDLIIFNLSKEEYKLLKGCLLTTRETFKCIPFKNSDINDKIKKIDDLIKKVEEVL